MVNEDAPLLRIPTRKEDRKKTIVYSTRTQTQQSESVEHEKCTRHVRGWMKKFLVAARNILETKCSYGGNDRS